MVFLIYYRFSHEFWRLLVDFEIVARPYTNTFALRHEWRRKFVYDVAWAQVPGGPHKKDLLENLDRVPTYVQQLQFTVKNPTVGKAATFTKVDNVIQETKNLMNVISKVVTTCFVCATKVRRPVVIVRIGVSVCHTRTFNYRLPQITVSHSRAGFRSVLLTFIFLPENSGPVRSFLFSMDQAIIIGLISLIRISEYCW